MDIKTAKSINYIEQIEHEAKTIDECVMRLYDIFNEITNDKFAKEALVEKVKDELYDHLKEIDSANDDIMHGCDYVKRIIDGRINTDPHRIPECNFFHCKTDADRQEVIDQFEGFLNEKKGK